MPSMLEGYFGDLPDPRIDRTKKHKLIDMIAIAICAVTWGAENWVEVEEFGLIREAWLRQFLELPNRIPSHDTFGRTPARHGAEAFRKRFIQWVREVHTRTEGQEVAIDGRTVWHTQDKANGKAALYLVSARATEKQLVFGQVKVDEQSNESQIVRREGHARALTRELEHLVQLVVSMGLSGPLLPPLSTGTNTTANLRLQVA